MRARFIVFIFTLITLFSINTLKAQSLDKAQVEAIIKEYLLKNPDVIKEAIMLGRQKEEQAKTQARQGSLNAMSAKLANAAPASIYGNPNGNVTLIEFFDYNCGYCRKGFKDLQKLVMEDKNLKVVFKQFPIRGEASMQAAIVGIALQQIATPEQYWKFHTKLMTAEDRVGKEIALETAKKLGVDMAKLDAQMQSPAIREYLTEISELTQGLQISGTPSYVLADEVIGGAVGHAALVSKIANVRKCGKTNCSS